MEASKANIVNRYPDIKVLAHKDKLADLMNFCMQIDPKRYDMIPPSFNFSLSIDQKRFTAYQESHKNAIYIAKP